MVKDSRESKGRGTLQQVIKRRAKHLGELLKGFYGTWPQAIKPPYHHRPQTRWEHLAYQGFILGIDSHSLVEVAHMLHRVRSTIVNGERWLIETLRKSCPFNLTRERQLRDLVQHLAHSIVFEAFVRWALIPTFTTVLLVV